MGILASLCGAGEDEFALMDVVTCGILTFVTILMSAKARVRLYQILQDDTSLWMLVVFRSITSLHLCEPFAFCLMVTHLMCLTLCFKPLERDPR